MSTQEDHVIELRIQDLVAGSPDIDPFAVGIAVTKGIVRLTGLVGSFAERLSAMELASGVVAPESIRNDIRVRPYGADWEVADEQIASDIRRELGSVLVPTDALDVEVDHHVVTLRGRLASRLERAEVRHVVQAVRGVDFVHNRITL